MGDIAEAANVAFAPACRSIQATLPAAPPDAIERRMRGQVAATSGQGIDRFSAALMLSELGTAAGASHDAGYTAVGNT
jgi:hypothetical protein